MLAIEIGFFEIVSLLFVNDPQNNFIQNNLLLYGSFFINLFTIIHTNL